MLLLLLMLEFYRSAAVWQHYDIPVLWPWSASLCMLCTASKCFRQRFSQPKYPCRPSA